MQTLLRHRVLPLARVASVCIADLVQGLVETAAGLYVPLADAGDAYLLVRLASIANGTVMTWVVKSC